MPDREPTDFDSWHIDSLLYSELYAADAVEAAAEVEGIQVYGGLGWQLYIEVQWGGLRGLWSWQRMQVTTMLLNGDENRARELLGEFGKGQRFARITRFHPGEHYHILGKKFDTFGEAKEFATRSGHATGAPETVYVYDREGD